MEESRAKKTIKNSSVALVVNIIFLILQFFSRKIFLEYLGSEILGLNTTAMNILQFLNLAELGIGGAVAFTLYKPIYLKDYDSIREIINLQGFIYKRIGLLVIIGAIIVMCFFPLIFSKIKIPLWYAYTSFGVFLFSGLLSYFVNYKEILLSADQKEYVIYSSYRIAMILKVIFQMTTMRFMPNPYIWWMIWEIIFAIVASIWLNIQIYKSYPYLKLPSSYSYSFLKNKYNNIIVKVKQVFFHKIAAFALLQTSPLIIYSYTTLTMVALYGNYMIVISGIMMLINSLFNGVTAGIGNLIAEGDKLRIINTFYELFSVRFIIVCAVTYSTYMLLPNFIEIWIGKQYILPQSTLVILCGLLFISLLRNIVDSFIWAYGLYNDVWAPIIETILNICLSIIFGAFWGLNGVIMGVITSLVIIVCLWKPYFLFKKGFKLQQVRYWITLVKLLSVFGLNCYISNVILLPYNCHSFGAFAKQSIIIFSLNILILIVLLAIIHDKGLYIFISRMKRYYHK